MAPRGSVLFAVLLRGRFPYRSDSRPAGTWASGGAGLAEGPAIGIGYSWVRRSVVCVYSLPLTFKWLILSLALGSCVRCPRWGGPSKVFLEKVVICERRYPSSHSRKTKNHLGCSHASFLVWHLGCHWVG